MLPVGCNHPNPSTGHQTVNPECLLCLVIKAEESQPEDGKPEDGQLQLGIPQEVKPEVGKLQEGKLQQGRPELGKLDEGYHNEGQQVESKAM